MVGFAALLMILVLAVLVLAAGMRWFSVRDTPSLPHADTDRLDRIESALSGLEGRLDDLQEQQRFLERLLEERSGPRSLPSGGPGDDPDDASDPGILFDIDDAGDR